MQGLCGAVTGEPGTVGIGVCSLVGTGVISGVTTGVGSAIVGAGLVGTGTGSSSSESCRFRNVLAASALFCLFRLAARSRFVSWN
jgi:hypothetical protein